LSLRPRAGRGNAERKRAALTTRLLKATGLITLVALSPVLINVSIWVSMRLDSVPLNG